MILSKTTSNWDGAVNGSIAKGTFSYRPCTVETADAVLQSRGYLDLDLDYFRLINTDQLDRSSNVSSDTRAQDFSPEHLPNMRVAIDTVVWGDQEIGRLQLNTSAVANGVTIEQFSVNGSEHRFTTTGSWVTQQSGMKSIFKGRLISKNLAHFLQHFGIYEDIRKTAATIDFDLSWLSSPFQIDWPSLNGTFSLKLDHGRLLGVEPGIGRALGLFSLSAWERRLRLDFSDVVDDGFAYDHVTADFAIYNGNAYSADLEIDGVAARVNFAGRIGLVNKDINAVVTVIPRSSIALPLAGAAGGPIGLGAGLVVQQLLGDEFETLSSSEYTISGSWTDPQVTLVPENGGIFSRMMWQLQKLTGKNSSTN